MKNKQSNFVARTSAKFMVIMRQLLIKEKCGIVTIALDSLIQSNNLKKKVYTTTNLRKC